MDDGQFLWRTDRLRTLVRRTPFGWQWFDGSTKIWRKAHWPSGIHCFYDFPAPNGETFIRVGKTL
jgi:hypothetical protein